MTVLRELKKLYAQGFLTDHYRKLIEDNMSDDKLEELVTKLGGKKKAKRLFQKDVDEANEWRRRNSAK